MGNIKMGKDPQVIKDIKALRLPVRELAEKLIAECEKQGLKIIITQTLRTQEAQKEYYSWGRTKLNPHTAKMTKVTNADGVKIKSKHQLGAAFDICIGIKGREYDTILLRQAGRIGMDLGLVWGGTWASFMDMPHFELEEKSEVVDNLQKSEVIATEAEMPSNAGYLDPIRKVHPVIIEDKQAAFDDMIITAKFVMIENRNFIRLIDLDKAGMSVSWDNASKMPVISTKKAESL